MATARRAPYRVKVAWDQNPVSLFTFGRSTFGGADTLAASAWSQTFLGAYDDITNDGAGLHVDHISIVRGREDDLTASRAGEITIELTDWVGKLNPRNTLSPLYGKLLPNRPLVVTAIVDGPNATGLTLSGNEITDKKRDEAIEGDGRADQDSSLGIWEATTNLGRNGGFETNLTDWTAVGAALTRVVTSAKFGATSGRIVTNNAGANEGAYETFVASGAVVHTASAWLWRESGSGGTVRIRVADNTGATVTTGPTLTLTGTPQRLAVATSALTNGATYRVYVETNVQQALTFNLDGVQAEAKPSATPYVQTDGATASRTVAGPTGPTLGLNATQGWVAQYVRPGFASSVAPLGAGKDPRLFRWDDGDPAQNNTLQLSWSVASATWEGARAGGGSSTLVDSAVAAFAEGAPSTVIFAWTATQIGVSVNGGAFVWAANTFIPTTLGSTFYLGNRSDLLRPLSGDVLWTGLGTGTLSDDDPKWIHAALTARREPLPGDFGRTAACVATIALGRLPSYPYSDQAEIIVPGVEEKLIYAWTSQIEHEPGKRKGKTTIHALDLMGRMDQQKTALASTGATTTGAGLGRLLDALQWTDPVMRTLATGDSIPDFSTDATISLLAETEKLIEPARGFFFLARQGVATFISRDQRGRALPVGKIRDVMRTLVGGTDEADIVNQWTIIRTTLGGAQLSTTTLSDQPSIDKYGFQGGSGIRPGSITTAYLRDLQAAQGLAAYLLDHTKAPGKPVWELNVRANVDAATLRECIVRDLNDRVVVEESQGGTTGDHYIEQIRHEISGVAHETTWRLTARPAYADPFTFGFSRFGGPDQLDFY